MKARVIRIAYVKGAEVKHSYPKDMIVDVSSSHAKYIPAELLVEVSSQPKSRFSFYKHNNKRK